MLSKAMVERKPALLQKVLCTQIFGIDFEETFSPVARFETVRLLLSIAALEDWNIEVLDVKMAFLFGELDEEIYIEQPEGFIKKGQEKKICHLLKAIYIRTKTSCFTMEQGLT